MRRQAGFSLVEIMIAMVIGMAAVIIMMQMLSNSDTAKRITVGGNDAQTTGTIALYNLERDIRSAGVGINSENLLGCTLRFKPTKSPDHVEIPIAPVSINDTVPQMVGETSHTLVLMHARSGESPDGDPLIATSTDTDYVVTTPSTFKAGDQIVLQSEARPNPCVLALSRVGAVNGSALSLDPDEKKGEKGVTGLPPGSIVYNLVELVVRAYAVSEGNLVQCDFMTYNCITADRTDPTIWEPVASNVVALLAQYGRDLGNLSLPRTGQISEYNLIRTQDLITDRGLRPECAWARTVSLRVGLVARSATYDKQLSVVEKTKRGEDLLPAPTWSGANEPEPGAPLNPTPVDFDLTGSIPGNDVPEDEWRKYRYKVFETTIPLRNLAPQGGNSAC